MSDHVAIAREEIQEQIGGLKYAKEIDDLRARVNVFEASVQQKGSPCGSLRLELSPGLAITVWFLASRGTFSLLESL